jgi:transcriptional adapter 3
LKLTDINRTSEGPQRLTSPISDCSTQTCQNNLSKGASPPAQDIPHSCLIHCQGLSGPDFSLPSSHSLLPTRPPIQPTPVPGPSVPTEVEEDFSKSKQPSQVLVSTFYTSVEPYLRPIKEEDIGFLEYTADEVEPFVMPKLGRHYAEVWEDDDIALYGAPLSTTSAARVAITTTIAPPRSKWDPSTLTEHDLVSEEKGHGPFTERLVSALLPVPDMSEWRGVKAAEDAMEGRPANGATAAAGKEKLSVSELEQRIKDTMRYHGLLDINVNVSPSRSLQKRYFMSLSQIIRKLSTIR